MAQSNFLPLFSFLVALLLFNPVHYLSAAFIIHKPLPVSGNDLVAGKLCVIRWELEGHDRLPTAKFELWGRQTDQLVTRWDSVDVSLGSYSVILPATVRSAEYYIKVRNSRTNKYIAKSPSFLVTVVPVAESQTVTKTITTSVPASQNTTTADTHTGYPNTSSSVVGSRTSASASSTTPERTTTTIFSYTVPTASNSTSSRTMDLTISSISSTSVATTDSPQITSGAIASNHVQIGPIIAGTCGGVAFLCILVLLFLVRRSRRFKVSRFYVDRRQTQEHPVRSLAAPEQEEQQINQPERVSTGSLTRDEHRLEDQMAEMAEIEERILVLERRQQDPGQVNYTTDSLPHYSSSLEP